MSGKIEFDDIPGGVFFVDPETLPGYRKPKHVEFLKGLEYAKRIKKEENRDVTFEEMQQFVTY